MWSLPVKQRQAKNETVDRAYSPAALCNIKGKPHVILVSNASIDCADLQTGAPAWSYSIADFNMMYGPFPEPIVFDKDKFFLGVWYYTKANCIVFQIGDTGLTEVWKNDTIGKGCYSCVIHGGHVYGYGVKGLNCVDVLNGKMKWRWRSDDPRVAKDQGEVILVGDKLVWLSWSGMLYVGEASPDKRGPIAEFRALGACTRDLRKEKAKYNDVTATSPVFASGRIYCRSPWGELVCVDVRE